LFTLGVGQDDVVPMLLANVPESQYALWGTQAAGIANPLNWMLEPRALASLVQSTNAKVLISYGGDDLTDTWDKVEQLIALCPQITHVVRVGGQKQRTLNKTVQLIDFDEVIDLQPDHTLLSNRKFNGDDIAAVF